MKIDNELISNIDKIHTTKLGVVRIKRNLNLETNDVVSWCKNEIKNANEIYRKGKNFYVLCAGFTITVNVNSCTIITAHKTRKIYKKTH